MSSVQQHASIGAQISHDLFSKVPEGEVRDYEAIALGYDRNAEAAMVDQDADSAELWRDGALEARTLAKENA